MKRAKAGRQPRPMLRVAVLRIAASLLSLHTNRGVCQGVYACVCVVGCFEQRSCLLN